MCHEYFLPVWLPFHLLHSLFCQCFYLFLLVCFLRKLIFFIMIINQLLHIFCFEKQVYGIPILQIRKVRPTQRGRMPFQTQTCFSGRMAGPGFNPTAPKSRALSSCRFKFQPNLENQRQLHKVVCSKPTEREQRVPGPQVRNKEPNQGLLYFGIHSTRRNWAIKRRAGPPLMKEIKMWSLAAL